MSRKIIAGFSIGALILGVLLTLIVLYFMGTMKISITVGLPNESGKCGCKTCPHCSNVNLLNG